MTPTLARPPVGLGILNQSYGGAVEWWRFDCQFNPWNPIANMTGQPAMSVPLHWTAGGLPVGSLIFGRFGDEVDPLPDSPASSRRPGRGDDRRPPVHALSPTLPTAIQGA